MHVQEIGVIAIEISHNDSEQDKAEVCISRYLKIADYDSSKCNTKLIQLAYVKVQYSFCEVSDAFMLAPDSRLVFNGITFWLLTLPVFLQFTLPYL